MPILRTRPAPTRARECVPTLRPETSVCRLQPEKGAPAGEDRTGRNNRVSEVIIKEGEPFEAALKRFTRKVQQDGLLSEAKRRQHYEPPSVKRKRKADARERKARKARAKALARGY